MPVLQLDHVNVRTSRLEALIAFYTDVLGMTVGPRPPFSFDGAWLYCGGRAVVHLVGVPSTASRATDLHLEHFAFTGDDEADLRARLEARGVPFELITVPGSGGRQLHFADPDGNHLHVDFPDR